MLHQVHKEANKLLSLISLSTLLSTTFYSNLTKLDIISSYYSDNNFAVKSNRSPQSFFIIYIISSLFASLFNLPAN